MSAGFVALPGGRESAERRQDLHLKNALRELELAVSVAAESPHYLRFSDRATQLLDIARASKPDRQALAAMLNRERDWVNDDLRPFLKRALPAEALLELAAGIMGDAMRNCKRDRSSTSLAARAGAAMAMLDTDRQSLVVEMLGALVSEKAGFEQKWRVFLTSATRKLRMSVRDRAKMLTAMMADLSKELSASRPKAMGTNSDGQA
jgi:hypothetical protein